MNDDISDFMNNLNELMNSDSSNNFKDFINNLKKSDNSNTQNSSNSTSSSDNNDSSENFNFDFETIMKIKNIVDAFNNKKDDPRTNLLLSLKPYLKESRKNKLDQYIQLFNMSSVFEILKNSNNDKNK